MAFCNGPAEDVPQSGSESYSGELICVQIGQLKLELSNPQLLLFFMDQLLQWDRCQLLKKLGCFVRASTKIFTYFAHQKKKQTFFLFYTPIFIKHLNQFIYFIHLFIKIFIILPCFIILSLTAPLFHRPNTLSQTQHTKESPVPVACELCCFRWRPILAVRSGSIGSNQSSYAPFSTEDPGPSTPFLC